eukprot:TRINITY_DN39551_c0_g1_i1.p1 TRINITY_DN39551_c0_g1~~TRINITY_DN39551_c0_g1_i1.p1  ORF type:complete len:297 (-),score=90.82 TRINITY_DN39551_c0_g1_i1:68-958(-)
MAHLIGQLNKTWADSTRQRELALRQTRGLAYMAGSVLGEAPGTKTLEQAEADWEHRQRVLLGGLEGSDAQALLSPARSPTKQPNTATEPSHPSQVTSLAQRLQQPQRQSRDSTQLLPRRMALLTKRSKRCPVSSGLIVKPELNPSKASFQKKSDAISKLPRATVLLPLQPGSLTLRLSNPLESRVTVQLTPWVLHPEDGTEHPFLFQVEPFTTTIGEGFLDPGVAQPLLPTDDPTTVLARTSNSVTIKLTSSNPVHTSRAQARISLAVQGQFFTDLLELTTMELSLIHISEPTRPY